MKFGHARANDRTPTVGSAGWWCFSKPRARTWPGRGCFAWAWAAEWKLYGHGLTLLLGCIAYYCVWISGQGSHRLSFCQLKSIFSPQYKHGCEVCFARELPPDVLLMFFSTSNKFSSIHNCAEKTQWQTCSCFSRDSIVFQLFSWFSPSICLEGVFNFFTCDENQMFNFVYSCMWITWIPCIF